MLFGVAALALVMTLLSFAAFQGIWKFQKLTKNIRDRSIELPLAAELNQRVSALRSVLWDSKDLIADRPQGPILGTSEETIPTSFSGKRDAVEQALERYHQELINNDISDIRIAENTRELEFVADFRRSLAEIKRNYESGEKVFTGSRYGLVTTLKEDLEKLQHEAAQIPVFMQQRMQAFSENARSEYHRAYAVCLVLALAALGTIIFLVVMFRKRIFMPLETLVFGARQVANGNYDHRIQLDRDDEVSELADALNETTQNFQRIQTDLNQKVQRGTQEVIRSEKMASVGFLAAGIAHEINNPLASIAWSAESLESRVQDILQPEGGMLEDATAEQMDLEIAQVKKYLSLIQEEAFRCKEITAGLLDFARMGDAKKVPVNIGEVVQTVVEMIKPMSKYRDRNLHYAPNHTVFASANSQELKQVALNLITNALGSVEVGGTVDINLTAEDGHAVLTVSDDGCGMTPEIKQHLFEPFFTRRRDGQGTGLGLSITYQIVQEHGGEIEPYSEGPGKGSTFIVRIPLQQQIEQSHGKKTAA
jgi:signal transduction histidine kinase